MKDIEGVTSNKVDNNDTAPRKRSVKHVPHHPSASEYEQISGWSPNPHKEQEHAPNDDEGLDIYQVSRLMTQSGIEFLQDVRMWGYRDIRDPSHKPPSNLLSYDQPSLQLDQASSQEVKTIPMKDFCISTLPEEPNISLSSPGCLPPTVPRESCSASLAAPGEGTVAQDLVNLLLLPPECLPPAVPNRDPTPSSPSSSPPPWLSSRTPPPPSNSSTTSTNQEHNIDAQNIHPKYQSKKDPQYDGDVHDPPLRSLSNLLSNDQFREEQSAADSLLLDQTPPNRPPRRRLCGPSAVLRGAAGRAAVEARRLA